MFNKTQILRWVEYGLHTKKNPRIHIGSPSGNVPIGRASGRGRYITETLQKKLPILVLSENRCITEAPICNGSLSGKLVPEELPLYNGV